MWKIRVHTRDCQMGFYLTPTFKTEEVRQVISKKTSEQVKSMMESVVTSGTGRHAAVNGYSIGGKTGTSEPVYTRTEEGYVASYVAISPIEDTQVVLLVTLYKPPAYNHNGGTLAGPVVQQMLNEMEPPGKDGRKVAFTIGKRGASAQGNSNQQQSHAPVV